MRALLLWLAVVLTLSAPARAAFSPGPTPVAPDIVSGLALSNDATTPATFIAVAPGAATSTVGGTAPLTLTSSLRKQVTAAWSAGTGGGALDTGTATASTWYHVFLIGNPSSGGTDFLVSVSATAPTLPSGWTLARRIGAVRTDGSGNVLAFKQVGATFFWVSPFTDVNVSVATTTSTATLTVPTGVQVEALFRGAVISSSAAALRFASPDETDVAMGFPDWSLSIPANGQAAAEFRVRTDTSARINLRAQGATVTAGVRTYGWTDPRN